MWQGVIMKLNKAKIRIARFQCFLCFVFLTMFQSSCSSSQDKQSNEENMVEKENVIIENNRYNIGEIAFESADSLDFHFNIKNKTDKAIPLGDIDVSCGCVSVKKEYQEIPANETLTLKGKIGLKGLSGKIDKTIFVNYGNNEVLLLHVVGEINQ